MPCWDAVGVQQATVNSRTRQRTLGTIEQEVSGSDRSRVTLVTMSQADSDDAYQLI
jgi:hypothetical protein